MDYAVKISELKLCSIQRYYASKLLFSYIFHGNDLIFSTEMTIFAVFADSANIIAYKVNFLLQTMKSSW